MCSILAACRESQFECTPGFCVSASKRCDGVMDCNDGKDEENCRHISTELTNYEGRKAPITCESMRMRDAHAFASVWFNWDLLLTVFPPFFYSTAHRNVRYIRMCSRETSESARTHKVFMASPELNEEKVEWELSIAVVGSQANG